MKTQSLTDRLEALLKSRPNVWIDSWDLLKAGGHCAWRSRLSDLRDRGMRIDNRQRRARGVDGQPFTISEYRWTPADLLEVAESSRANEAEVSA